MKQDKLFCGICHQKTWHRIYNTRSDSERIITGIFTFGFALLLDEKIYECLECGCAWEE
jgi:hypothetical protein